YGDPDVTREEAESYVTEVEEAGAHEMNDTLVGCVMGAIAEYSRHAFGEIDEPMQVEPDEEEMIRFAIGSDIIDIVTAARDAEIAEALRGGGAQGAFWGACEDAAESAGADPYWLGQESMGEGLEPGMKAALAHIGLHGDGTGGQG